MSSPADARTGRLRSARTVDLDPTTLYRILRLRGDVFVVEQSCAYPDLDGRDLEPGTRQFWIGDEDGVHATLRLLTDPVDADGALVYRIGRVCTDRAHRGRRLGARLIDAALAEVGAHACRIDAQAHLTGMYGAFGFVAEGDEYLEDGIPHVSMFRKVVA
ncbi:GNAT family N-acetyltransferase [Gordonia sp. ABSL1-1]|uniref:GNAT family N-acetyltransferase n=1 Tax=Gordonia sp. ABSL1-1 TaxID=3053923 RepID=UPI00257451BA|nr:GNAT family N-acetyltransferase [Gordonia sp. ABSL1-1]MDL9936282.1 GNAT family N-acetyltransferase [Gordonia sp. ABSL1-1]